jgi:hypothetical protein
VAVLVAHLQEAVHDLPRDDAEGAVLAVNPGAGEHLKPFEVQRGEPLADPPGRLIGATAEDDVVAFECFRVQARDVLRWVLQIAVHDDDPIPTRVRQTGGDGGVLSEVAAQQHAADRFILRGELLDHRPRAVARAVIDEHDLIRAGDLPEHRDESAVQVLEAARATVDRDDDAQFGSIAHRCTRVVELLLDVRG